MARLSPSEYEALRRTIAAHIAHTGYVPPVRDLAEACLCSPVTAWRIVRSLGWRAKGHRWVKKSK